MRRQAPALLILVILTLSPLLPASAEPGRANENNDTFVAVSGYTYSTSPLHIGDQNVTLSITLRNLRQTDGNASNGDERLRNVTVEMVGVENSNGQLLQPPASPLVWDVTGIDNNGDGYTLGFAGEGNNSCLFSGLMFDVKGFGVQPGSYNVSILVHYIVLTAMGEQSALSEGFDTIRFDVASNVVVGTPVAYTDTMTPTPLYAGAGFQLVGVSVRTVSGTLKEVVGTLSVPDSSRFRPAISPGASPEATVERITGTATLYFRIEVPVTDAGVYDASNANITLSLRYVRESNWNGRTENIGAGEEGLPLTFTLEYTPMVNATGASPTQISRGAEFGSLSVILRNEGNADLVRLKAVLEADADFSPADYHYDGSGNRVPGPAECDLASLKSGENATAVFHVALYPLVPPGVHRLSLSYSGYLYNTGKTGASSGYYPITDALFQQLRGQLPYVDIEVKETQAALVLLSSPSPSAPLNPDGESEGLNLDLRVRNDEHFGFLNARFTVLAGEGTPVRDPADRSARSLQTLSFPSFGSGDEEMLEFGASLNTSLQPGLHQLTLRFNGTSADSGTELSYEQRFAIRTGPFGPNLQVDGGSGAQLGVKALGITIPVTVQNSGGAALSDVDVRLTCGPGTPIDDPAVPSATVMVKRIGRLGTGSAARVEFTVDLDPSAEARTYLLGLQLAGSYSATGEPFSLADNITFKVLSAPPLLVVLNASANPAEIIPGKGFTLVFTVKNIGGENARSVWVGLQGLAGTAIPANASSTGGASGLPGEVPFSADIAVRFIGDLAPGQEVNLSFSMMSDTSAGRGRTYQQPVQLWYQDQANAAQYQQFPLAVRTKAAPAPAEPPKDLMPVGLLLVLIIVIIVAVAVLLAPRRAGKEARPSSAQERQTPPPQDGTPSDVAESQVALAVPMQQPPPPPPGYGMAPSQPLPPPPPDRSEGGIPTAPVYAPPAQPPPPPPPPTGAAAPKATRVEGGAASHAGPLEGYSIPGAEADQPRYSAPPQKPKAYSGKEVPMRTCPTCGNEVKVRFVKCPYCGSDLPPVT